MKHLAQYRFTGESLPLAENRGPVPTAEVDPGFRRESEEGDLLNHLNGSER